MDFSIIHANVAVMQRGRSSTFPLDVFEPPMSSATHLYGLVLVDAQTVHQAENLFAVLPDARFALSRQGLLV